MPDKCMKCKYLKMRFSFDTGYQHSCYLEGCVGWTAYDSEPPIPILKTVATDILNKYRQEMEKAFAIPAEYITAGRRQEGKTTLTSTWFPFVTSAIPGRKEKKEMSEFICESCKDYNKERNHCTNATVAEHHPFTFAGPCNKNWDVCSTHTPKEEPTQKKERKGKMEKQTKVKTKGTWQYWVNAVVDIGEEDERTCNSECPHLTVYRTDTFIRGDCTLDSPTLTLHPTQPTNKTHVSFNCGGICIKLQKYADNPE